jgi:hypothetical protein
VKAVNNIHSVVERFPQTATAMSLEFTFNGHTIYLMKTALNFRRRIALKAISMGRPEFRGPRSTRRA